MARRRELLLSALALPALAAARPAAAAETIRIGALYPLTGNSAAAGQQCKAGLDFGVELVNKPYPDLAALPLAAGAGLPRLGGARVATVLVDHHGDPALAQTETLRLITQDHVVALEGAYQSSCAYTATAVAERYGIPFVVSDSVAANITGRGYQFVFRVTPIAANFAATYMRFIGEMKEAGHKIDTLAVVNENTDYGTSVGDAIVAAAKTAGLALAVRIPYSASAADLSAEVLTLKRHNPSLAIFVSYTSDSILYMKTMHSLGYRPPMVIGDDAGFNDPSFLSTVGPISQGAMSRSVWSRGPKGSLTDRLAIAFKAKTGIEMNDLSGRVLEAFLVLADAIDRAGSTAPKKLQAALRATDMKPAQLLVGYDGVKFDKTGQNVLGATYLTQLQGRGYVTVWPAAAASAKLEWPMPA